MSAASFIGLAGGLLSRASSGYGGLAYVLGWTGGFCLVALLRGAVPAPVRPVHDSGLFRRALWRPPGRACSPRCPRSCARFTYVVAQIYGIGLIASRLTGRAVRDRHLRRAGRRAAVLVSGRHARHHLDPGGAVRDPDAAFLMPGALAVVQADRASRCRRSSTGSSCRRSPSARRELMADPEGTQVMRHSRPTPTRVQRQACGRRALAGDQRAAERRRDDPSAQGEHAARRASRARRRALTACPGAKPAARESGPPPDRRRRLERAGRWAACRRTRSPLPATRTATRPRREGLRTSRAATSWRWCSA